MIDQSLGMHQGTLKKRICFFGLTKNFHPFFIPLAKHLESRGMEGWFYSFWPGEIASLKQNRLAERVVDWKRDFFSIREPVAKEQFETWMATDPEFPRLSASQKEHYRRALEYVVPGFRRALAEHQFDAVFFWNGFKYPDSAIRSICEEAGVTTLYGENGAFAHTMQIDPVGVNAASQIYSRSAEDWLNCDPQSQPEFERFIEKHGILEPVGPVLELAKQNKIRDKLGSAAKAFITERAIYSALARKGYWEHRREYVQVKRAYKDRPTSRNAKLPGNFIFLPFQVHDDTQITIQSPWVHRMETMVEAVIKARDQLGINMPIVVKEHPVDVGRYSYENRWKAKGVTWLWDYPLDKLLKRANCVVTVNSSVGLEAVVYGKPVVTLGNAIYNVPGVVEHAPSEAELPGRLNAALTLPVDTEARRRFLCRLRFDDLVSASWRRPTETGVRNAADRILSFVYDSSARR